MATINVSESTKKRFRILKLKESAKKEYNLSEDEFTDKILDRWENKK